MRHTPKEYYLMYTESILLSVKRIFGLLFEVETHVVGMCVLI